MYIIHLFFVCKSRIAYTLNVQVNFHFRLINKGFPFQQEKNDMSLVSSATAAVWKHTYAVTSSRNGPQH